MNSRCTRGLFYLSGCSGCIAVSNVVAHRVIKQNRVLRNNSKSTTQTVLGHKTNILPINRDAPTGDIVKTKHQPRQGGFTSTRRPDYCDCLTSRNFKTDAMQNRSSSLIGKLYILEPNSGCLQQLQCSCIWRVRNFTLFLQQTKHTV